MMMMMMMIIIIIIISTCYRNARGVDWLTVSWHKGSSACCRRENLSNLL